MSKQIQLTIPKPCHENWDGMSDTEKGKFCGSCQKQVVDFTNMSDRQLAEFFKKPSTGSVCGRFMTDQLERDIAIPKKRIPWLKYFFTIALPAFFATKVMGQQRPKLVGKIAYKSSRDTVKLTTVQPVKMLGEVSATIEPFIKGDTIVNNNPLKCGPVVNAVVSGKVIDEFGAPIPNATISFAKRGNSIITDNKGEFVFPKLWLKEGEEMIFGTVGYISQTIKTSALKENSNIIKLETITLGEVIVKSTGRRSCHSVTAGMVMVKGPEASHQKNVVIKENKPEPTKPETKMMSIFPNPIKAGTALSVKLNSVIEGYYTMQIIAVSGQLVQQKEIWIDEAARVLSIDIPVVSAGTYILQLTNKKTGAKASEKLLIQ